MKTSYREIAGQGPGDERRTATTRGLLPGEPVFVIRAKDANALGLVNFYRMLTQGDFEGPRAQSLDADIESIRQWRRDNEAYLRDPD